jgi:pyruvate kinase
MSKSIDKYLHSDFDNKAGVFHAGKRTKIVATVGPACNTYDQLLALVKAGVNVFRLNFSHGLHEEKAQIIEYIRQINKTEPYNIAILADLQGPKLRVGALENDKVLLVPGAKLTITTTPITGTAQKISVSYPNLQNDVKAGEKIMFDDGKLEVLVDNITAGGDIETTVLIGGDLLPKKGMNLPDTAISLPALTEKDLVDLEFAIAQQVEWIALSFVRKPVDIIDLKEKIKKANSKCKVIAKIEMPEAIKNLRDIIIESDAIMIARGDLGVELPVEEVPLIQKDIIRKCIHRGKPVIVATQMMESMIDRTKPNRSEITDVANAVLEGTDAVMLSGETATGKHPVLVIETMTKIILEIERKAYRFNNNAGNFVEPQLKSPSLLSDAICYGAVQIATDVKAAALVGMTQSGYTAFMLSSVRPQSPIYIFTKERTLVNQLSLSWGVRAFFYNEEESIDDQINDQIQILKEREFVELGDVIVHTGSTPVAKHLPTNIIKISKVE